MITYTTIVKQMEQHITQASHATTEQQLREQLTAVRALCDVVLTAQPATQPVERLQMSAITEQPVYVSATQPVMQVQASPQKLQENDANGDSIFDF